MRKRLAIIFCMMIMSLCGVFGCNDNPYKDMSIDTLEGVSKTEINQLLIYRDTNDKLETVYQYPDVEFSVKVSGFGDASPEVLVSGWEGYLEEPEITYQGDGISKITSRPVSYDSTGKFTLKIRTVEGNKSVNVQYAIDLKMDSFDFAKGKLQAVATDQSIVLDDVSGLIEYIPDNTTQKALTYSVVFPSETDNSWNKGAAYSLDADLVNYYSLGYKYADVVSVSGKQVLKVYSYYRTANGQIVKDEFGEPIPTMFPQVQEDSVVGGVGGIVNNVITLKAYSSVDNINVNTRYLDIEVVPGIQEISLSMNLQGNDEEKVVINKDEAGEYNVVLVDPDYKGGLTSATDISYFTERHLWFTVETLGSASGEGEYEVIANNITSNDGLPVDISMIGKSDEFKVHALTKGKYSHKFTLRHSEYTELFTQEMVINFNVISVPFKIQVNDTMISTGQENDITTTVYNVYAKGSYGTKFKVDTNSNFSYFVFGYSGAEDEQVLDSLTLRRDGDGARSDFAIVDKNTSATTDKVYSSFSSKSSFYLMHSFSKLPVNGKAKVYIGVKFTVADDSYSADVKKSFQDLLFYYPINLNIENGISSIDFEHDHYYLLLVEGVNYGFGNGPMFDDKIGHKLWDLPEGKTVENSIKSISYDKDQVEVYDVYDAETGVTSLYVRYAYVGVLPGTSRITIETLNGLKKSVVVDTFIDSMVGEDNYADEGGQESVRMGVSIDTSDSGYLYHMSGKDIVDHQAKWELMSQGYYHLYSDDYFYIEDIVYDSVDKLFLLANSEIDIDFYDFARDYSLETKPHGDDKLSVYRSRQILINQDISVSFNTNNYVTYNDGVLKTNGLVTSNINLPIIMSVKYNKIEWYLDGEDKYFHIKTVPYVHTIEIYIYEPIADVKVTSELSADLYLENSLGYFDKDLSLNTIYSTYAPDEKRLGAEWNAKFKEMYEQLEQGKEGLEGEPEEIVPAFTPVQKLYDYSMLDTTIKRKDGGEVVIKSFKEDGSDRTITYGDLFTPVSYDNYKITFQCVLSQGLLDWFDSAGYTDDYSKNSAINQIFGEEIEFVVNIYVVQFNRLQNVNSVRYTAKYAEKVSNIELDIDDDGVYFEMKEGELNNKSIVIDYTLGNSHNALNKKVVLQNFDTISYSASVEPNIAGNGGRIIVTPKLNAGIGYISITTEDNISDYDGTTYSLFNTNLLLSFRVKVADGSSLYPFEIRSANDYLEMYNTTKKTSSYNGKNYNYVITRNIDLKGYNVANLTVENSSKHDDYSLSGKHTYYKNGEEIVVYSSIYNFEITSNIQNNTAKANTIIGLFSNIGSNVTLDNVSIKNARINITDSTDITQKTITIGILAGEVNNAIITSCSVSGYIKLTRTCANEKPNVYAYLGGMVGYMTGGTISSLPGNYETGVVVTGNNVYVDIAVDYVRQENASVDNTKVDRTVVGGLVGVLDEENLTTIKDLQVVSNITTTIRSTIGSVVGKTVKNNNKTRKDAPNIVMENIDISPSIVTNIETTNSGTGLYAGGLIGHSNAWYDISGVIINFVDIGNDSGYSWHDKSNMFIYASADNIYVGGFIGYEESAVSTIDYSYIRSYYTKEITDSFYGNIIVVASSNSAVGGLIGYSNASHSINNSYFDANITFEKNMQHVGMLVGLSGSAYGTLNNVYAVGLLNTLEFVTEEGSDTTTIHIGEFNAGFNSVTLGSGSFDNTGNTGVNRNDVINFNLKNVYVVANERHEYTDKNMLNGDYYALTYTDDIAALYSVTNIKDLFENKFLPKDVQSNVLTYGEDANLTDFNWFWHKDINTMQIGNSYYAYPVLLNGTKVMYDLVPTAIEVIINEREGLYNITYEDIPQVIMYLNVTPDGVTDGSYYEMSLDKQNSAFVIKLKGAVINTTYVNANNLTLNNKVEFIEDSNESIIRIDGNKVYPVATGVAKLTVRSYVSKSVYVTLNVVVVNGLTDFDIYLDGDTKNVFDETVYIGDSKNETNNAVYIDEITDFELFPFNHLAQLYLNSEYILTSKYVANTNIGFILELLDASETTTLEDGTEVTLVENGVIKINGIEYSYNAENIASNIYNFNSRNFKISGVELGRVKFVITPYIYIDSVNYVDYYTSVNPIFNVEEGEEPEVALPEPIAFNNIYLLNNKVQNAKYDNLQREYEFDVRAKAIDIEVSKTAVGIDARNVVDFNLILETANVIIKEVIPDETTGIVDHYLASILENINVRINSKKFNAIFKLKDMTFKCFLDDKGTLDESDDVYTCIAVDFKDTEFDYALVNIKFDGLTISKTNIDTNSRNNTYKLVLSGSVFFDRDHYRANANDYDLNTAVYSVVFIPETNTDIQATMKVSIVPNEVKTIFTNFYSKGVDKADSGDYETEYPDYNESTFIVPGRDGLLKITLDEEFNNSSYITITLNKEKYQEFISLQQLAAVVDSVLDDSEVGAVLGYKNVVSLETFETSTEFGIKLSKLSLNYQDNNYFNNTYYVKVLAEKGIDASTLDMTITSYKTDSNNITHKQLSKDCSLKIMELPEIRISLDSEVIGRGVRKELDVYYKGVTNDIEFYIVEELNGTLDDVSDPLYISDEEGNLVRSLNIEYLNSGKKYYLCQEVLTPSGSNFTIHFTAEETLLGCIETSRSELFVTTVDFEIDEVLFCGVGNNDTLELLHGANIALDSQVYYKKIEIGSETDIENYEKYLTESVNGFSIIELAEYEFAGTKLTRLSQGVEEILTQGILNLQFRTMNDRNEITYEDIDEGSHGGITISQDFKESKGIYYVYYEMKGTTISDNTYIRLDLEYYYDSNGKLRVGDEATYTYDYTVDVLVVVTDNSTYDHPIPIENQEDLKAASATEGGNFILLNNIELDDWVPTEALFDSLDGNGYRIIINNFELSAFRGENKADVGIFTTISENSLLKNITIDVFPLLKTETSMVNDISKMRNSSQSSYVYGDILDLGYTKELNFGILAGVNKGSITNAKVITTSHGDYTGDASNQDLQRIYLHVLTTQGTLNDAVVVSNIGGLVGHNDVTGAISNSFIGVNISNYDYSTEDGYKYFIEGISDPSSLERNNETDVLDKIQIYPFVLAGGNNIGGLACINDGIISNSYTKGLGVYNSYPAVGDSATAGLVTYNNNVITSSFVEGDDIQNFRAIENRFVIESTGYIGGLVYENNATIENSYTNAYVQTLSSFLGGFVFINNKTGVINNSYTTAVNRNSLAVGQFTGVKQGSIQNFGTYNNCYYLVDDENSENKEFENVKEHAVAILNSQNDFDNASAWSGFAFVTGVNADGIWSVKSNETPRIDTTLTDTISFRRLTDEESQEDGGTKYIYDYDTYYLGTKENPLIIDKAEYFDQRIIDSANTHVIDSTKTEYIFGYRKSDTAVRYVRIVNNMNFENITSAKEYDGKYLYNVIFNGVLDGNGMTMSNLNLNTDHTGLDNFGLFAQIGWEESDYRAVVKNLSMTLRTYKSTGNSRAGVLAGTIVNSSIVNVKINGSGQTVSGLNAAGALAGLVYSTSQSVTLIDIVVDNIRVESTYGSLGGTINSRSQDKSGYFFNSFTIEREGQQSESGYSFKTLYDSEKNLTNLHTKDNGGNITSKLGNVKNVSYAGGVAGILLGNNTSRSVSSTLEDVKVYRSKADESTIDNVVVQGNVIISTADTSGGLFGYVGENTLVKNSKLIVSDNQLLKGFNNIGGIVGENHGIIEQSVLEYDKEAQAEYDATILTNEATNGAFNLFDMSEGEPYYAVSIGGIAGFSEDGVIIDSYVKVNVIKELAFISGGIVGYSKGNNYIGYVFNTGAVYGQYVVGGIIGLQVNTDSEKTYISNVISLTNWNVSDDNISIRDEITKKLYNNYKFMYTNSDNEYFNYYIKMPEVGNAPIESTIDTTTEENYRKNHTSYYIGSVVGKTLIRNNATIDNGTSDNYHVFNNYNKLDEIYSNTTFSNVFSSTLGMYTSEGNVASGTRVDDYFDIGFEIDNGDDSVIESYSYRIAYNNDLTDGSINHYEMIGESTDEDEFLDRFVFNKVFTAQEYRQQILGSAYYGEYSEDDDNNIIATKVTKNIFSNGYSENRTTASGGVFIENSTDIWEMDGVLPKYYGGTTSTITEIKTSTELIRAFKNTTAGKTYKITQDINVTINNSDSSSGFIEYYSGIKSVYVGTKEGGNPVITFEVDSDSYTSSVFQLWSGATFQNIDFVIKVNNTNNSDDYIDYTNYGIFVNTLEGVYITNCNFTIVLNTIFNVSCSSEHFNAENIGVLFGSINNSNLENVTFKVDTKNQNINLSNNIIQNFGLVAGKISGSNIKNCKFELGTNTIGITESSKETNIGGIAGAIYSSKITNSKDISSIITMGTSIGHTTLNVSTMFGYANRLNYSSASGFVNNLQLNYISSSNIVDLSVSLVIGRANQCRLDNLIIDKDSSMSVEASTSELSEHKNKNNGNDIPTGDDSISIGSMIGYDESHSQLGKSDAVGGYANISATLSTFNASIGGLVGRTKSANQLISNAFYDADISVENSKVGQLDPYEYTNDKGDKVTTEKITTSYTFIGGVLGRSDGKVGIANVVSGAIINLNTIYNEESSNCKYFTCAIGGIIGGVNGNTSIENFVAMGELNSNVDVNNSSDNIQRYSYVSGVLGLNKGLFASKNGYSYIHLQEMENAVTSSITNGLISSTNDSVYYTQEFVGNNYSSDKNFQAFAMANFFGSVSEYSNIYKLESEMTKVNIGAMQMYFPNTITTYITRETTGNSKFNPHTLSSGSGIDVNGYNVIEGSCSLTINTLNGILSGRSISTGKVILTINYKDDKTINGTSHFVTTNNGVLSNVYLRTGLDNNGEQDINNVALVGTNNGLITNCYIYGLSYAHYALAKQNNGKIYASASAIKYVQASNEADADNLYGLVVYNGSSSNTDAIISDCYSASFGYTESESYVTNVYGFASTNYGKIQYSTYYIIEDMLYDNINCGSVKGLDNNGDGEIDEASIGTISNSYNSECPKDLIRRSAIWEERQGFAHLIGIKEPEGSMVIRVYFTPAGGEAAEIKDVADLKNSIYTARKGNKDGQTYSYTLSYKIDFYVAKEDLPVYNVLRVSNNEDFIKALNSLSNNYITNNTIIMFTNNITKGSSSHVLDMNINELKRISLSQDAAMIGVNSVNANQNIVLNYVSKGSEKQNLLHEFVTENKGLIAGFTLQNIKFTAMTENSSVPFAPILNNYGIIDNLVLQDVDVVTTLRPYVAGIVGYNHDDGLVSYCMFKDGSLSSLMYINPVCIYYDNIMNFIGNTTPNYSYKGDYYGYRFA